MDSWRWNMIRQTRERLDQVMLDALMVAAVLIIFGEDGDRGAEVLFAQENEATQTFFLDRTNKALGGGFGRRGGGTNGEACLA